MAGFIYVKYKNKTDKSDYTIIYIYLHNRMTNTIMQSSIIKSPTTK